MTITCPKCGKEVEYLHVYTEVRQKFYPDTQTEWGYDGDYTDTSHMDEPHDIECPECCESVFNEINVNYYGDTP